MDTLFIPLALAAGALLAVQAGANTQLAKATGSPFAATTLQLGVGALLLLVFTLLTGSLSALSLVPRAPAVARRSRDSVRALRSLGDPAVPTHRRRCFSRTVHRRAGSGLGGSRHIRTARRRGDRAEHRLRVGAAR